MSELKPLSTNAIDHAIEKAQRYRLLNQPLQAESICLDVLHTQPDNEQALIELTLALSDQLADGDPGSLDQARQVVQKMNTEYHQAYYSALLSERQALVLLKQRGKRSSLVAFEFFNDALAQYEVAMHHKPDGEDESILRWNFCKRMINKHQLNDIDPEELEDLGIE